MPRAAAHADEPVVVVEPRGEPPALDPLPLPAQRVLREVVHPLHLVHVDEHARVSRLL